MSTLKISSVGTSSRTFFKVLNLFNQKEFHQVLNNKIKTFLLYTLFLYLAFFFLVSNLICQVRRLLLLNPINFVSFLSLSVAHTNPIFFVFLKKKGYKVTRTKALFNVIGYEYVLSVWVISGKIGSRSDLNSTNMKTHINSTVWKV